MYSTENAVGAIFWLLLIENGFRDNLQMTSKLKGSTPDDFVVTGLLAPVSAAGSRRPREALQRSWLSWISIQGRARNARDRHVTLIRMIVNSYDFRRICRPDVFVCQMYLLAR